MAGVVNRVRLKPDTTGIHVQASENQEPVTQNRERRTPNAERRPFFIAISNWQLAFSNKKRAGRAMRPALRTYPKSVDYGWRISITAKL
jgi:hypothetical protein